MPRVRVAGLMVKDDKVLLISHQKNNEEYWLLPGGGMERGELAKDALVREFAEELNADIEVDDLLFVADVFSESRHILQLVFAVRSQQEDFRIGEDPVLGRYAYFSREELKLITLYPDIKYILSRYLSVGEKALSQGKYYPLQWKN